MYILSHMAPTQTALRILHQHPHLNHPATALKRPLLLLAASHLYPKGSYLGSGCWAGAEIHFSGAFALHWRLDQASAAWLAALPSGAASPVPAHLTAQSSDEVGHRRAEHLLCWRDEDTVARIATQTVWSVQQQHTLRASWFFW